MGEKEDLSPGYSFTTLHRLFSHPKRSSSGPNSPKSVNKRIKAKVLYKQNRTGMRN